MINLIPPEVNTGYAYARRNVALRQWVIAFLVALAGLGAITTYGLLTLKQSTTHYQNQNAATEDLFRKEKSDKIRKDVKDISNNFKLAVKVLSQEVLFSQLIRQIASAIPDDANLTGLSIPQVQGGLDITAEATDYRTATQVQVNLSDPANKIFSKADIINVACGKGASTDAQYPCSVTIRALFAPNNPFLFINDKGAGL